MRKSICRIAWDCFVDLGVTVVYATIAGLLIVGIVATDDGPASLLSSILYASLLPATVTALIGLDIALGVMAERRRIPRGRLRAPVHVPQSAMALSRS